MIARRPSLSQLPAILPVFPLDGAMLLPGGRLPLNVFEPRYLAMVDDALKGARMIGMIQPADAGPHPMLRPVGCAGRIVTFAEAEDGRYLITLQGVCRFDAGEELPIENGYRRLRPGWARFARDLTDESGAMLNRPRLFAALKAYFRRHEIDCDWKAVENTPDDRLVTLLSMVCPFEPDEKQALLEAPDSTARAKLMTAFVETAALQRDDDGDIRH